MAQSLNFIVAKPTQDKEMFSTFRMSAPPPEPEQRVASKPSPSPARIPSTLGHIKTGGEVKPLRGPKLKNYQKLTRTGVEYILKAKLKRANKSPTKGVTKEGEPPKKRQKSFVRVINVDELCKQLKENCQDHRKLDLEEEGKSDRATNGTPRSGRLVAVQNPENITEKLVYDIRNKFCLDSQGIIRTKPAFHKNQKSGHELSGSVLLWPEEVTSVMKHKFRATGNFENIDKFFDQLWRVYQPRLKREELMFRKELTEYLFTMDDVKAIQEADDEIVEKIRELRRSKINLLEVMQKHMEPIFGGDVAWITDSIQKIEEGIVSLRPDYEGKHIDKDIQKFKQIEENEEAKQSEENQNEGKQSEDKDKKTQSEEKQDEAKLSKDKEDGKTQSEQKETE